MYSDEFNITHIELMYIAIYLQQSHFRSITSTVQPSWLHSYSPHIICTVRDTLSKYSSLLYTIQQSHPRSITSPLAADSISTHPFPPRHVYKLLHFGDVGNNRRSIIRSLRHRGTLHFTYSSCHILLHSSFLFYKIIFTSCYYSFLLT